MALDTQKFAELLQTEQQLLENLHNLLQLQLQALKENALSALEGLQPQNERAVAELQTQAALRLDWMQSQQLDLTVDGLLHPALKDHDTLRQQWHSLDKLYQQNQILSATLAETVLTLRHRTQIKLKILQGGPSDPQLYNDKGKASQLNSGHKYVQA